MRARVGAGLIALGLGGACGDGLPPAADGAAPSPLVTVVDAWATPRRELDLLFVVGVSPASDEPQFALAVALPRLVQSLATAPGGLPDLHVGVVSTDVGTGSVAIGSCPAVAADGELQTSGCAGLGAPYLADLARPDGRRDRNYTGTLADRLGCMVRLGSGNCGFEQPLEAMRRALTPGRNPGFRRPGAALGVVIVSHRDDCSAVPGGALFSEPTAGLDSVLGPLTGFRCFEWGVRCADDVAPRALGPRHGCLPREGSPLVTGVAPYVAFLREQVAEPRDLVVATIAGSVDEARSAEVVPDLDAPAWPYLAPSCGWLGGVAWPALRLRGLVDGFPGRGLALSLCADSAEPAVARIGARVQAALGQHCLAAAPVDLDPATPGLQPRCEVTEATERHGVPSEPRPLASCAEAGPPCWRLVDNPAHCPDTPGQLALAIDRVAPAPADAVVAARCQVDP